MMKNKAGWVALIVLAIASVLMFFFVLPNREQNTPAEVATTPVAEQTPVAEATTPATGDQSTQTKSAEPAVSTATSTEVAKSTTAERSGNATPDAAANPDAGATPDAADAGAVPAETAKVEDTPAQAADAKPAITTPDVATPDSTTTDVAVVNAAKAATADPTAKWTVPGFDVLRVEPDGSTVIAGKAQPGTSLEIVDGGSVIAKTDVGPSGDFAAVFDEPLSPGDYELSLRSVGKDGAAKSSVEVATVSVPKTVDGPLLAMVSKPGEASRVITTPEAKPSATIDAPATTDDASTAPVTGQAAPGTAANDTAAATAIGQEKPALADPTTSRVTVTDPETAAVANDATATGSEAAQTKPAIPAQASTDAATVAKLAAVLSVSAVEIEGSKIFVAGNATPGALVRIYANDQLVGEAKADAAGRFVVDGVLSLPVGRHTIRADMLSADGKRVEFRAAVPFDRPEGDQVAAVAEPQGAATSPSAATADAAGTIDGGRFDALRSEATKAFALLKGLFSKATMPEAEQLAAARSATEIALRSLAEARLAETVDAGLRATAERISTAARAAFTMLRGLPQDANSVSAALAKIESAIGPVLVAATPAGTPGVAPTALPSVAQQAGTTSTETKPATAVTPTSPADNAINGTTTSGQPATGNTAPASTPADTGGEGMAEPQMVQQAPLKQSKTSVIIRRGDTLWQISRRVYGAGVRYTTIYIANETQIRDPDRILPGQIFGVPDTAMPDAESQQIHRKHMTGHD